MKIKEIVKSSALMLGRENVVNYLCGNQTPTASEDTISEVERLTALTNLVISELAASFVPIAVLEKAQVSNGRIYFNTLKETPLKILDVLDNTDNSVSFVQYPEFISVSNGDRVLYEYLPKEKTIEQDCPYEERIVPSRVLSYGVASEFCITEGEFEQAVMWHKRYVDALEDIIIPKNRQAKNRRWA